MIEKLRSTSLPGSIVNIIQLMLRNSSASVFIDNINTKSWNIENGTRKGGLNSPNLFSWYLNQTVEEISTMSSGCSLGGIKTNILCYADDICILSPSAAGLQNI